MLDVGAHYGSSLQPFLSRGWRILAFEPDPANRAELRRRIDVSIIKLFECALSDHEQDAVPFFASDESSGISTLNAFHDTHREVARVRLRTLRQIVDEEELERVDFLKGDTEGHDLFVLRGFPWEKLQPEVILCEFEDAKTMPLGYSYKDMGNYLLERGYRVFLAEWHSIVRYGGSHQGRDWRAFPCSVVDNRGWGNFVSFRPGTPLTAVEAYLGRLKDSRLRWQA